MTANSFPGGTVQGAVDDPKTQYKLFQHILYSLDQINNQIGQNNQNPSSPILIAAPPPAQFTVKGQDGDTHIDITNPQSIDPVTVTQLINMNGTTLNPSLTPIQHRIQKSTDETFSTPSLITELPLTYDTHIVDKDPNTTKFWRLQSRFDGGAYNAWQLWNDPQSCGPVSVWSGLLMPSSNDMLNSAATTSDGTAAISQDGVTTNILIATKTWNVGNQQIPYTGGQVDPGAFGSYLVYAVDPKKAGGAVTFLATLAIQNLTAQAGIVYFGNVKTLVGGGGAVSGGGQGGGGCVATGTRIFRPNGICTEVQRLKKGDRILGIDGEIETLQADPVPAFFPCFRFVDVAGAEIVCSHVHLLIRDGGLPVESAEIHAPYRVLCQTGTMPLKSREYVGKLLVWELKLDRTRTYCANGFWSHNKIFKPL